MKLYESILLALCLITAGCGDDDSMAENPLAPTALAAAALVPAVTQDATVQNATMRNVDVRSVGHGGWRVTNFTLNNSGPYESPGSVKLTVQESQIHRGVRSMYGRFLRTTAGTSPERRANPPGLFRWSGPMERGAVPQDWMRPSRSLPTRMRKTPRTPSIRMARSRRP